MSETKYDAVIIGAGPGGYVSAIRLGQLGKKVALVEKNRVGGVCLNAGCIPSKALLHAAKVNRTIKEASMWGFDPGESKIDPAKVIEWKDGIVDRLVKGILTLLKAGHVELVEGMATVLSPVEVKVRKDDGEVILKTENIIVATGTSPISIPGFQPDYKKVIDSTAALSLKEIPPRLLIIGGGVTGMEMAEYFSGMGSSVSVVEMMDKVLPMADGEVSKLITRVMKKKKIKILTSTRAVSHKETDNGIEVTVSSNGKEKILTVDMILVSVGRKASPERLGIDGSMVKLDDRGHIVVDDGMRSSNPHIFAIGDITGEPWLAHKASRQGVIAAEVIAGLDSSKDFRFIPSVVYTDPEIAWIGMTEEEAAAKGRTLKIGRFPYSASGRALSSNESDGFVKIITDSKTEEILGVHIVCSHASEMISEATLAMETGANAEDLSLIIHPHPTLSEGIMEAAENVYGRAIHMMNER